MRHPSCRITCQLTGLSVHWWQMPRIQGCPRQSHSVRMLSGRSLSACENQPEYRSLSVTGGRWLKAKVVKRSFRSERTGCLLSCRSGLRPGARPGWRGKAGSQCIWSPASPPLTWCRGFARPRTAVTMPRTPPLVSGALPLLGHAPAFLRDQLRLLERGYAQHGEVFRLRLGRRPAVFLLGPERASSTPTTRTLPSAPAWRSPGACSDPTSTSWPNRSNTSISARPCCRSSAPRWERTTWPSWSGTAPADLPRPYYRQQ